MAICTHNLALINLFLQTFESDRSSKGCNAKQFILFVLHIAFQYNIWERNQLPKYGYKISTKHLNTSIF